MSNSNAGPDWDLLGEMARARRERLGLSQGDLSRYGGPGGTTVGKIERAEQRNFPPRTRQQLERALGWKRGTVDFILEARQQSWVSDEALWQDWLRQLVEDNPPDLTAGQPVTAGAATARTLSDEELLAELTYRMRRYAAAASASESHDEHATATIRAGVSPAHTPPAFTTSVAALHLPLAALQQPAASPPPADDLPA